MSLQTVEEAAKTHADSMGCEGTERRMAINDFKAGAAWQKEQGIDWISVITKPPRDPHESNINCSINVLVWGEGHYIVEGVYFPDFDGWRCKGAGNWQPSHWAYINLPTT